MLTALGFGAARVLGIEVNGTLVQLLRQDLREFTRLDGRHDVTLVHDDGRSWMAPTDQRFDLIQMSLIDTLASTAAGAMTLTENGLYTSEAWNLFLDRLRPGGVLSVSRYYQPGQVSETARRPYLGGGRPAATRRQGPRLAHRPGRRRQRLDSRRRQGPAVSRRRAGRAVGHPSRGLQREGAARLRHERSYAARDRRSDEPARAVAGVSPPVFRPLRSRRRPPLLLQHAQVLRLAHDLLLHESGRRRPGRQPAGDPDTAGPARHRPVVDCGDDPGAAAVAEDAGTACRGGRSSPQAATSP